ncbi:PilW family protein [Dyella sp. C9]|uniref:PilW family protein n=1 Tax=Dyella sp. C9 TaxID=2202154 RepID=UPI0018E520E5|nr:PilW family protein [Dyella sp. C9]
MKPRRIYLLSRRQAGMSLIELMVSMVLGLIVVGGLVQVLIANRRAYQIQQGNNFLQQNLRFASDRLGWSLRMADFWGGMEAQEVQGVLGSGSGASGCNTAWVLAGKPAAGSGAVFGYDGRASFPIAGCVANADYVAGSDVLVVRYADTDACDVADGATTVLTNTCSPSSHYLVTTVGQQAQLFQGKSIPALGGSTRRYVYPYRVEMYYLQPCADRGNGCKASSDDGQPQPTLMRMRLTENEGMVREPLVDGIEQMQLEYGLSPANPASAQEANQVVDYRSASAMQATDWPRVLAVRINLVARGRERDPTLSHAGTFALTSHCSYTLGAGGTFALTSTSTDCDGFSMAGLSRPDQFVRSLQQQVVQVRNRVRGG